MGDIGSLLYPGSLSTVYDGQGSSYLNSTKVHLKKLIDFDNKKVVIGHYSLQNNFLCTQTNFRRETN